MADDVRLSITGDNRGIKRTLSDTERAYIRHERKTQALFSRFGKGIGRGALGFTRSLAAPITALAGGAAYWAAGKNLMAYEAMLTRIAIQGGLTAAEQENLNKQMMSTALAAGQDRMNVLSGLDIIVEQLGDLEFARDIIKDIAIASTATGAEMSSLGALAVQLKQKLNLANNEIKDALNTLTVQGKYGAFTLKDMADNGERLFAAAGRFDMKGLDSVRSFGALMQVARMGTGSSEQATTSIEGILSDILSKQKKIAKYKINLYTDKDKTQLKALDTIIKEIIVKTKGREDLLGNIFGRQSIRGITTLAKLYRDTGGFALFDELVSADAERAGEIMLDFARYSETTEFSMRQLANLATVFGDSLVGGVLSSLNADLRELTSNPEKMEEFKKQLQEIGKNVGDLAKGTYDLVAALNALIPLINVIGYVTKTFISDPIEEFNTARERQNDIKRKIQLAKQWGVKVKDVDRLMAAWDAADKNPTFTSQMFLQYAGNQLKNPFPEPVVNNEINIYQQNDGSFTTDTDSTSTKSKTVVRELPRGVHPVARK